MNVLYHFTSAQFAAQIVSGGKFHLTMATGNEAEEQFANGKLFFLSTTRTRSNIFATRTKGGSEVMFVLDADKLRSNNKLVPVNFWGSNQKHSEAEERLISDKPTLSLDCVVSVHCNTGINEEARIRSNGMFLRVLAVQCRKRGLPIYAYGSKKDMLTMLPAKRIGLLNEATRERTGKVVPTVDNRPDFIKQIEKEQDDRNKEDMMPFMIILHAALRRDFKGLSTYSKVSDVKKFFEMFSNINGYKVRESLLSEMSRRMSNARYHGGVGSNQLKIAEAFVLLLKRNKIAFNEVPNFIANRIAETVNVE